MNDKHQQATSGAPRIVVLLLIAIGFLVLGGLLRTCTKPPPPPRRLAPTPRPLLTKPTVPERPPIRQIEPVPERRATPELPPPRPKKVVKRRKRRRRYRRRKRNKRKKSKPKKSKPKKRKKPKPKKRKKPKPKKRKKPKPKKRKKPKPKKPKPRPKPILPSRITIWHTSKVTGPFEVLKLEYKLGERVLYTRKKGESLPKRKRIYQATVMPGNQPLFVSLKLKGIGFGVFSYLNDIRIHLRNALALKVKSNQDVTVEIICHENKKVDIRSRLSLKLRQSVKPLAKSPSKQAPAK